MKQNFNLFKKGKKGDVFKCKHCPMTKKSWINILKRRILDGKNLTSLIVPNSANPLSSRRYNYRSNYDVLLRIFTYNRGEQYYLAGYLICSQ